MLSAQYNNDVIFIHQNAPKYLKKLSDNKLLKCPDCKDILIFKECYGKQSHFAHIKKDCSFPFREPESIEHETGKIALFDWIKQQFGEENCSIEKKIDITNQRADTFIDSLNMAVEIQCSPIHENTWKRRTDLYTKANVEDIWILGYSMHKKHLNNNKHTHKLNRLEEAIYNQYGKIIYFDVLTKQFIFLFIEKKIKNYFLGTEYFFKPNEVEIRDNFIYSKYEYFIQLQKKREEFLTKEVLKADETDQFIKDLKSNVDAEKILATKKQINYIKFLLYNKDMKIPYKLHGLLKEEADVIIKKLINNEKIASI